MSPMIALSLFCACVLILEVEGMTTSCSSDEHSMKSGPAPCFFLSSKTAKEGPTPVPARTLPPPTSVASEPVFCDKRAPMGAGGTNKIDVRRNKLGQKLWLGLSSKSGQQQFENYVYDRVTNHGVAVETTSPAAATDARYVQTPNVCGGWNYLTACLSPLDASGPTWDQSRESNTKAGNSDHEKK